MADERRVQERFFLNLQAKLTYWFLDPAPKEYIETVAANISNGGAFLRTDRDLPLASKVKVEFLLSSDDLEKLRIIVSVDTLRRLAERQQVWVQATGVVIRRQEDGVAVIFDQNYRITPMQTGND